MDKIPIYCILIEAVSSGYFTAMYVWKHHAYDAGVAVAAALLCLSLAILNAGNG